MSQKASLKERLARMDAAGVSQRLKEEQASLARYENGGEDEPVLRKSNETNIQASSIISWASEVEGESSSESQLNNLDEDRDEERNIQREDRGQEGWEYGEDEDEEQDFRAKEVSAMIDKFSGKIAQKAEILLDQIDDKKKNISYSYRLNADPYTQMSNLLNWIAQTGKPRYKIIGMMPNILVIGPDPCSEQTLGVPTASTVPLQEEPELDSDDEEKQSDSSSDEECSVRYIKNTSKYFTDVLKDGVRIPPTTPKKKNLILDVKNLGLDYDKIYELVSKDPTVSLEQIIKIALKRLGKYKLIKVFYMMDKYERLTE